nr:CU044_5270 family protein [Actinomadura mexicana]
MHDEVPPPSPEVLAEGRTRLVALARDGGRRDPRLRRHRGMLAVALAGGVAAAGAVVVATQGSDGGPREVMPVSAHEVLTRAAAAARLEPELHPRPGQYLYIRSVVAWGPGKSAPDKARGQETRERWVSVDGSKPGLLRAPCHRRGGPRSATPPSPSRTRARPSPARAASSGSCVRCRACSSIGSPRSRRLHPPPSPPRVATGPSGRGTGTAWASSSVATCPPKVRAQVFEFLSDVPRVKVDEHAADAIGRPAVALSQDSDGGRLELMFDRSTYRFLGSRCLDRTPRPDGGDWIGTAESGAGEVKTTVLQVEVADRLPTRS